MNVYEVLTGVEEKTGQTNFNQPENTKQLKYIPRVGK